MRIIKITFLCIALQCFSFVGLYANRAYLDMQWESCKKRNAVFVYETADETFINGTYYVPIYYTDGTLYCEGSFSTKEVSYNTRNGKFTYYFRTGKIMCEGSFEAGAKTGLWTIYYKQGGKERVGEYKNNSKVGKWIYYNEEQEATDTIDIVPENYTGAFIRTFINGQISSKSNYTNGTLHGLHEDYFRNGFLSSKGEYDSGKKINEWNFYHKNGNKAARILYGKNERIDSVFYFNEEGIPETALIDTAYISKCPDYKDNQIQQIIGKNLVYPSLAVEYGIMGKIMIEFIIKSDGTVYGVKSIDDIKLDFGMEEECIRVVKDNFIFSPFKIYNTNSSIKYRIPIKFRLK